LVAGAAVMVFRCIVDMALRTVAVAAVIDHIRPGCGVMAVFAGPFMVVRRGITGMAVAALIQTAVVEPGF